MAKDALESLVIIQVIWNEVILIIDFDIIYYFANLTKIGIKCTNSNDLYIGCLENGVFEGVGIIFYNYFNNNGLSYFCGNFKKGKKEGIGIITSPNGNQAIGKWQNDENIQLYKF